MANEVLCKNVDSKVSRKFSTKTQKRNTCFSNQTPKKLFEDLWLLIFLNHFHKKALKNRKFAENWRKWKRLDIYGKIKFFRAQSVQQNHPELKFWRTKTSVSQRTKFFTSDYFFFNLAPFQWKIDERIGDTYLILCSTWRCNLLFGTMFFISVAEKKRHVWKR